VNKEEIAVTMRDLDIQDFIIHDDGTVDVATSVDIGFLNLKRLPVVFGRIRGDFNCSNNQLESLEGAPRSVGLSFFCHNNHLASLAHAPLEVGKSFVCKANRLKNLEGVPLQINGSFDCSENQIATLVGGPEAVNGDFDCSHNCLNTLDGMPHHVRGALYCQGNPIPGATLARFKALARFVILAGDEA